MAVYKVFISHSSVDTWVAEQIAAHIKSSGAAHFLDSQHIETGDDFEIKILRAADSSTELLVLLTPWALNRPYIWVEIGLFLGQHKRIVGVLHGLTVAELSTKDVPVRLKRLNLITLNEIGRYFGQLEKRVKKAQDESAI